MLKNPTNGMYLTRSLFFETTLADKTGVMYTLKDEDHEGYPSLYRLYMEEGDPTEWRFANKYLAGWAHWEKLCECVWFKDYLDRWRRELELKYKSESLARIITLSKTTSKEQFIANRYIIEKGWNSKESTKGRPSKQQIREAANDYLSHNSQVMDDFKRLGIN